MAMSWTKEQALIEAIDEVCADSIEEGLCDTCSDFASVKLTRAGMTCDECINPTIKDSEDDSYLKIMAENMLVAASKTGTR